MDRMDGGDAAQVTRALGGDQDAFRALVERHSRSLFRLAYRMTGNESDAQDVVQETFLRAYRRLDRFESRANFGTWLYRIGVNCSLDMMRKRKTESSQRVQASGDDPDATDPMDNLVSGDPQPDRMMLSAEVKAKVQDAMKALSPVERTAFILRHFEGHSIEEIGKSLGLGAGATKNSVFRAVQKLRRQLEPLVSTGE
jgi:RNA polymerase sigma-70 factor (ECF subfamily)